MPATQPPCRSTAKHAGNLPNTCCARHFHWTISRTSPFSSSEIARRMTSSPITESSRSSNPSLRPRLQLTISIAFDGSIDHILKERKDFAAAVTLKFSHRLLFFLSPGCVLMRSGKLGYHFQTERPLQQASTVVEYFVGVALSGAIFLNSSAQLKPLRSIPKQ